MPLTPNDNLSFLRRSFGRLVMLTMLLQASSALAGDWPQILGPNRSGIAANDEQLLAWPSDGPKEVWTADVGQGFAGVAVRGDTVILFHRTDEREVVEARSATTGRQQWAQPAAVDYRSGMSSDSGPRCVPLIHEDRILVFGIAGHLRCLAWEDGSEIWSRDTWKDFGAPEGYFGAGSSPLVTGNVVVVNVGGRSGAAVVGFDVKTGRTVWSSFDDTASYSSPIAISRNDRTQAVVITRLHTLFLNPADGDVIDSFPFGARGPTVNGASPVWIDDHIFVSSSYRVGSVLADCRGASVKAAELGEDLLATQYATPVRHERLLYAVDGRQDIGSATVKCIDPLNKRTLWQQPGFDYGTLLRVRDELIFLTCGGELIRFAADDTGYKESHRSTVLESTPRGYRLPALSNGRLYIRDDQQLKCLQVGLSKSVE